MWSKECELLKKLSDAELESLTKLCRCGSCDGIPLAHTEKLHALGLAFDGQDPGYPVVDALDVHVDVLARLALGHESLVNVT